MPPVSINPRADLEGGGWPGGIAALAQETPGRLIALFVTLTLVACNAVSGWMAPRGMPNLVYLTFVVHIGISLHGGRFGRIRTATWLVMIAAWSLAVAIPFLGYVLPWGQLMFWLATLVARLPVMGEPLAEWLYGNIPSKGLGISGPVVLLGLLSLDAAALYWAIWRDGRRRIVIALATLAVALGAGLGWPFGAPVPIDPLSAPLMTPAQIMPSLFEIPFYAMLRARPNKMTGVLLAGAAQWIWFVVPWLRTGQLRRGSGTAWRVLCFALAAIWAGLCYVGVLSPLDVLVPVWEVLTAAYFGWFALVYVLGRRARPSPDAAGVGGIFD